MLKLLLFLMILTFIPPLSFADELADHNFETSMQQADIYIILQLEIRDPNQNLVGYIETDRVTVQNIRILSGILDDMSQNSENTKIVTIDDKKYEVITGLGNAKFDYDTVVSVSVITHDEQSIVFANYDGFQIKPGDVLISTWTMIRPA